MKIGEHNLHSAGSLWYSDVIWDYAITVSIANYQPRESNSIIATITSSFRKYWHPQHNYTISISTCWKNDLFTSMKSNVCARDMAISLSDLDLEKPFWLILQSRLAFLNLAVIFNPGDVDIKSVYWRLSKINPLQNWDITIRQLMRCHGNSP